jgi:hypothetical protein
MNLNAQPVKVVRFFLLSKICKFFTPLHIVVHSHHKAINNDNSHLTIDNGKISKKMAIHSQQPIIIHKTTNSPPKKRHHEIKIIISKIETNTDEHFYISLIPLQCQ